MNQSAKKIINFGIKLSIAVGLAWAIYRQVFARKDADELWQALVLHFEFPNLLWLILVLAMAPLNLAFESLKFRQLIYQFAPLTFWQTFKSILAGTTIAIFTPNRIGEYGGRVLFVKAEHNWKAVIATMVGSLAQLLILLSFGLLGTVWFSSQFLSTEPVVSGLMLSLGGLLVGLLFFGFFNIDLIVPFAKRIPGIYRFQKHFKHLLVLKNYTRPELKRALLFAFLRYLTYSLQYYFLLKFYAIPVSFGIGMAGISTIFFVQASIPLPPLMGLLARGEIALFTWGMFSQNEVDILAATFSLFVINIAIPALLGLAFIVQTNILKTLGYENSKQK